mgnify:CR=1 FL=1
MIKLIECPRDAMQGIRQPIPIDLKIRYLRRLLDVGFDILDLASFVSPRAIPQMADTPEVLEGLADHPGSTQWLVIVANRQGAHRAMVYPRIDYLGYPFSLSETFMQRNANRSIQQALDDLRQIQLWCREAGKSLVAYVSMGFGNPYGEAWSPELVVERVQELVDLGIQTISLSDTVGTAHPDDIQHLFAHLQQEHPEVEWGAHFHARPDTWREKIQAAYEGGCRRFDGALQGYGGCPMAEDELVGNIPTEKLVQWLEEQGQIHALDDAALQDAQQLASQVFAYR